MWGRNMDYGTVSVCIRQSAGISPPRRSKDLLRHRSKKKGRTRPSSLWPVRQWLSAESPSGFIWGVFNALARAGRGRHAVCASACACHSGPRSAARALPYVLVIRPVYYTTCPLPRALEALACGAYRP